MCRATACGACPCPFWLQGRQRLNRLVEVGAHQRYRTKHGKRVFRNMPPRRTDGDLERLAAKRQPERRILF